MLSTSRTNRGPRAGRRVWMSLVACLCSAGSVSAQNGVPPANLPPVQSVPATIQASTLEESIALAMSRQPALAAARATYDAAVSAKRGLDSLKFGAILAPDLPTRKRQACLGISIAASGLQQA
ncbi:MAG: hypothetical protein WCL32_24945, partial [Planctomycetota bacterium]